MDRRDGGRACLREERRRTRAGDDPSWTGGPSGLVDLVDLDRAHDVTASRPLARGMRERINAARRGRPAAGETIREKDRSFHWRGSIPAVAEGVRRPLEWVWKRSRWP